MPLQFIIFFTVTLASIAKAKHILFNPPESSILKDNPSSASDFECGQYDFRCIDETSYQICTYIAADDSDYQKKEPSDLTHQCGINTICDLDNPAFCSPKHPIYMPSIKRNINNNEIKLENGKFNDDETLVTKGAAGIDCTHFGYFPGNNYF